MTRPPALRQVLFVKRVAPDYTVPFLLELDRLLAGADAALTVLAGRPDPAEGLADGLPALPFGRRLAVRRLPGGTWTSPGAWPLVRQCRLVLLEQAAGQLINYPVLLRRGLGRPPAVGLVGHGAHFNRATRAPLRDAWRRFWLRRADRFFAYTARSARAALAAGVPAARITVFDNAVDTAALAAAAERLTPADDARLAGELFGTAAGTGPAGLFCGRLVKEKNIPFLLDSLQRIRDRLPGFRAIVVGDGPEAGLVRAFTAANPWCAWAGRRSGTELAPYLRLADLVLHPAPAGLAVLDAFALGKPFATLDTPRHGPEIEYLRDGVNGLLTPAVPEAFAVAAAALLADPARLAAMGRAAREEARLRTVANMAARFAEGVLACLDGPGDEGGRA